MKFRSVVGFLNHIHKFHIHFQVDTKRVCPPLPPSIPNGLLVQTNSKPMNNVYEYRCKDGFYMIGNSSLSCTDDGTWSNEIPSCRAQALREPSKFIYFAMVDYDAESASFTRTTASVHAVVKVINFLAVLCPKPINVENGSYLLSQDPPKPGAHVLYSCNVGYSIQGGSILTCLSSGSWSSVYPHCQSNKSLTQYCANFYVGTF